MQLVDLNISLPCGKSTIDITLSNTFLTNCIASQPFMHSHSKYELHFVSGADCIFVIDGAQVPVADGQILLICPAVAHSRLHRSEDVLSHISVFSFALTGQPDPLAAAFCACKTYAVLTDTFGGKARVRRIQEEVRLQAPYFYEKICGEFYSLLSDLARALRLNRQPAPLPLRNVDQNRTEIIESYIFNQYGSPTCSSKELAQQLFLTERQLYRVMMANYGCSFREMLLRTRMERADFALKYTSNTIAVIAEQVGYGSAPAFTLAYRKYYGRKPRSEE